MARRRKSTRARTLALAYVRVSTAEQAQDGASLDAQRAALTAEAERRGWDVELVADEGLSAKSLARPGLADALDRLDRGEADSLLAVRIDRLSRSVVDFAGLVARANQQDWRLVLLSPDLDTRTSAGKFTAHVLSAAAEYERSLIGDRVREGMAQRRAEGVHLGRPSSLPAAVIDRVRTERAAGRSYAAIAEGLNSDRVPTAHGGVRWYPATVRAVAMSRAAASATAQ